VIRVSLSLSLFPGSAVLIPNVLLVLSCFRRLQIEALERLKLEIEEEMDNKIKSKDQETERKLEKLREDCSAREEELRKKGYAREKEFSAKQEASRADYLLLQEEFQAELLKKDEDFRKQTALKEKEFQKHLESMLQGKMNAHVQQLQEQLTAKALDLEALRTEAAQAQQRATQQQKVLDGMHSELNSLQLQKEELSRRMEDASTQLKDALQSKNQLKQQIDGAAAETESLRRRSARLEESLAHHEKELTLVAGEKDDLVKELGLASQTLLKRGDDFSESVRLLQRRLDSSDSEAKALHEKLREAYATNARISSELEQAHAMLKQHNARAVQAMTIEGEAKQVAALQEQLFRAQAEVKRKEEAHAQEIQQERAMLRRTSAELQEAQQALGAIRSQPSTPNGAPRNVGAFEQGDAYELQQRIIELENYVQEVQPRIDSTQRENDTLTEEMDKVLAENAMIRDELEDLKESIESSHAFAQHGANLRASMPASSLAGHASSIPSFTQRRPDAADIRPNFSDHRPRRTSGVHGTRLVRNVFGAWSNFTVDMRGAGRSTNFSCLNHFCDNEGHLAPWMPVGRIRQNELEVKPDKVGSGTFAEVFKGEVKIPCAIKRMKGHMQQKEIVEFVREGEMMRKVILMLRGESVAELVCGKGEECCEH